MTMNKTKYRIDGGQDPQVQETISEASNYEIEKLNIKQINEMRQEILEQKSFEYQMSQIREK